jgi:hypothetical protein
VLNAACTCAENQRLRTQRSAFVWVLLEAVLPAARLQKRFRRFNLLCLRVRGVYEMQWQQIPPLISPLATSQLLSHARVAKYVCGKLIDRMFLKTWMRLFRRHMKLMSRSSKRDTTLLRVPPTAICMRVCFCVSGVCVQMHVCKRHPRVRDINPGPLQSRPRACACMRDRCWQQATSAQPKIIPILG